MNGVYIGGGFLVLPAPSKKGLHIVTRTSYIEALTALLAAVGVAALVLVMMASAGARPAQAQDTTDTTTGTARGTTIKVNTIEDESTDGGNCSLREAIEAADTNQAVDKCKAGSATGEDSIRFSLGKEATIVLGSTLPRITDTAGLTIDGRQAKITVSGNDAVRVFRVGLYQNREATRAKLTLEHLTVADGFAHDSLGGAITIDVESTLKVKNSTFSGNSADRPGGAIYNNYGTVEVTNSTFSDNSANNAGALFNWGTMTVTNSTLSGNRADSRWYGALSNAGHLTLRNTIVANNSPSGRNCQNLETHTDGGYNIDDGNTCGFSAANNSKPDTDPLLDPNGLQNNGGPTKTIGLLSDSPAINSIPKGENGCGTEIKADQQGVSRPQGSGCDIGAFEKK